MFRYKYFYCKQRMVGYLNGELSDSSRRRVSRYIDECDDCYKEYVRQRELQREIRASVPGLGRATDEQLNRIWGAIEIDLIGRSKGRNGRFSFRYGIIAFIFLPLIIIPLLFSHDPNSQISPTQPSPQQRVLKGVVTEVPNVVAVNYQFSTHHIALTDSVENDMMPKAAPGRTPNPSR